MPCLSDYSPPEPSPNIPWREAPRPAEVVKVVKVAKVAKVVKVVEVVVVPVPEPELTPKQNNLKKFLARLKK